MPFPLSSAGTFEVDWPANQPPEPVVSAIEHAIREAKPTEMTSRDGVILFRNGMYRFVNAANPLTAIGSGSISCTQHGDGIRISYHISFLHLFIIATGFAGGACLIEKAPLWFPIFGWLWLFMGSYLERLYRFPRFIKAAAFSVHPAKATSALK